MGGQPASALPLSLLLRPRSFGWDYRNTCQINLNDVLMELSPGTAETVLYDPYLQNGANSLYPIPVKITNYVPSALVNDGNAGAREQRF